jgi:two-component system OmpR family response regulator
MMRTCAGSSRALGDLGHQLVSTPDGAEALRLAAQEPWDILILDRMLPGLDGLEVVRHLRARGWPCRC